jgi:hypothetical protein
MRSGTISKIGWTAALALALAALSASAPGAALAGDGNAAHHRQASRGAYWGAWIGSQLTGGQPPWDMSAATRFESLLGKRPSLLEFSGPFATCDAECHMSPFPAAEMEAIRSYGAIPIYSWGSQSSASSLEQPEFRLANVAAGGFDGYIREFAEAARNWGHPFFLRFDWEMNGSWFPWGAHVNGNSPGDIVAAWRHVHDIFTAVGATNATWVWCPYADGTRRFGSLRSYYPGRAYVDWTCLDGYNWGSNSVNPAPWRSFDQIFSSSYRTVVRKLAPQKPMMLGEVASNGIGRGKATWIRRMFEALNTRYPRIRALAWFDQGDRDLTWPLETSPAVTRAFSQGVFNRRFKPGRYQAIAATPIPVPR